MLHVFGNPGFRSHPEADRGKEGAGSGAVGHTGSREEASRGPEVGRVLTGPLCRFQEFQDDSARRCYILLGFMP